MGFANSRAAGRADLLRRRSRDSPCVRERYGAQPESIALARRTVRDFAAAACAPQTVIEAIVLATSEAVTNVVMHAYAGTAGTIDVNAWLAGSELWVLVADDGCGLRAGRPSLGLGQGLAVISSMSDSLSIHDRSTGGTEVRMRFDLLAAGAQRRGSVDSAVRAASPTFSTTR